MTYIKSEQAETLQRLVWKQPPVLLCSFILLSLVSCATNESIFVSSFFGDLEGQKIERLSSKMSPNLVERIEHLYESKHLNQLMPYPFHDFQVVSITKYQVVVTAEGGGGEIFVAKVKVDGYTGELQFSQTSNGYVAESLVFEPRYQPPY